MSTNRTPAEVVLEAFRDIGMSGRALARHLELAPTTVSRWCREEPEGCGGLIPSRHQRPLLQLAAKHRVPLTAEDLILGRK